MHYIYCYTNKINQHKYVGQTNNLQRRINEHKSCAFNEKASSYNDLIHKKIRQYGIENFQIDVLETLYTDDIQEVNEREIYWIKKLSTFRGTGLGYNSDLGGGNRVSSLLSMEELASLKQEIKEGISFLDLQKKYKVSSSFLSSINHGVYFFDDKEQYPLYKYYKTDVDYDELIDLLLNSSLSLAEIAKQLNMGYSTVKKINAGTLRKGLYHKYPIREKSANALRAEKIQQLLLDDNYSLIDIMNLTSVTGDTIKRINAGLSFHNNNLTYPLRNL